MRIQTENGEILEVSESYARRAIAVGKAIGIPETEDEAPEAGADSIPTAEDERPKKTKKAEPEEDVGACL